MPSRLVRYPLLLIAATLLAGCDPFAAPESMLDEYVDRVGRVLDVEPRRSPVPVAPELPRRRDRVRPLPDLNVGMLDFLGLYGCELQHVVGERNSGMGRVMHPSNALDYELRFIRAADDCVADIDSERLIERIGAVTKIKRETIADVAWNAVWGTREIEDFFTRSRGALVVGHDPNRTSQASSDLRLLEETVERVVSGDLGVDITALDPVYQRWNSLPLMGQAIRAAILLATRLDDAAVLIESRLDDRPLCHKQMRNRQADIMRNMFMSVYAEHVQPYMASVQRVRQSLLPPLQTLAAIGDLALNPAFADYAEQVLFEDSERSHWQAFDLAVRRHTVAWQQLLEQCGMRPGQSS